MPIPDEQPLVARLEGRALVALSGESAESFLQGQLTCDVHPLRDGRTAFGGYCNPKGRAMSVFRLFRWGERFVLDLREDVAGLTHKRLELYRMRTPVTIERLPEVASWGLAGHGAAALLEEAGFPVPESGGSLATPEGDVVVLALRGGVPRYAVHGRARRLDGWKESGEAPRDAWRLLAMRAGDFDLPAELSETFTANMLNLWELGGVSFEKGCFPGQEVVARTHHLGKPPRRLRHGIFSGRAEPPAPGTKVSAFRDGQWRAAGVVVEAACQPGGPCELLAVIAEAQADAPEFSLGEDGAGPPIERLELVSGS